MEILDAVLAISLSMVVFSTMVSVIVEAIYRFLGRREAGLKLMMTRFFDDLLWARFRPGIIAKYAPGMAPGPDQLRTDFLAEVTKNTAGNRPAPGAVRRFGQTFLSPPAAQRLTVDEFVRRLASTDVGRTIARYSDAEIKTIIDNLAHKFVDYASDARQYFREKSRFLSVVVAIGLAGFANIDASRLFLQFMRDAEITKSFLADDQKTLSDARVAQKAKATADEKAVETKSSEGEASAKEDLAKVRQRIDELSSIGLAIGEGYFPYCTMDSTDADCKASIKGATANPTFWAALSSNPFAAWWWGVWVVLTGLLIGLGGPFWFDFYANLSRWVNVLRGLKNKAVETKGRDTIPGATTTDGPDSKPIDTAALTEAFKAEIEVQKILGVI